MVIRTALFHIFNEKLSIYFVTGGHHTIR